MVFIAQKKMFAALAVGFTDFVLLSSESHSKIAARSALGLRLGATAHQLEGLLRHLPKTAAFLALNPKKLTFFCKLMSYDRNSCLDASIETASFIGHDLCGLLTSPESAKTTASFSKSVVAAHLAGTPPGLHHKLPRPQLLEAAHLHLETADPSPSLVGEHAVLTNVNSFKHRMSHCLNS